MAITRMQAEGILLARAGRKMALVDLDAATKDGNNPDLNEPLASALLGMGEVPADILAITDGDLADASDVAELLDRAELRLLETIAGNIDLVDVTIGPRHESLSQLAGQVENAISRLTEKIQKMYGAGVGTISGGSISLDFVSKGDDDLPGQEVY